MGTFTIIFVSKDFDQAVQFYGSKLQFPILNQWDRGPGNQGCVFRIGDGQLEILAVKPGAEYKQPANFEISSEVEDADQFYAYVKSAGVPIRGEIADKPWGARAFSVTDPDGIKLIFSSKIK